VYVYVYSNFLCECVRVLNLIISVVAMPPRKKNPTELSGELLGKRGGMVSSEDDGSLTSDSSKAAAGA